MSVMVSAVQLFIQQLAHANNKETPGLRITGPVLGNLPSVDSLKKGLVG